VYLRLLWLHSGKAQPFSKDRPAQKKTVSMTKGEIARQKVIKLLFILLNTGTYVIITVKLHMIDQYHP
jgi:hypothetical protein